MHIQSMYLPPETQLMETVVSLHLATVPSTHNKPKFPGFFAGSHVLWMGFKCEEWICPLCASRGSTQEKLASMQRDLMQIIFKGECTKFALWEPICKYSQPSLEICTPPNFATHGLQPSDVHKNAYNMCVKNVSVQENSWKNALH